jgi:hypothetical protein
MRSTGMGICPDRVASLNSQESSAPSFEQRLLVCLGIWPGILRFRMTVDAAIFSVLDSPVFGTVQGFA